MFLNYFTHEEILNELAVRIASYNNIARARIIGENIKRNILFSAMYNDTLVAELQRRNLSAHHILCGVYGQKFYKYLNLHDVNNLYDPNKFIHPAIQKNTTYIYTLIHTKHIRNKRSPGSGARQLNIHRHLSGSKQAPKIASGTAVFINREWLITGSKHINADNYKDFRLLKHYNTSRLNQFLRATPKWICIPSRYIQEIDNIVVHPTLNIALLKLKSPIYPNQSIPINPYSDPSSIKAYAIGCPQGMPIRATDKCVIHPSYKPSSSFNTYEGHRIVTKLSPFEDASGAFLFNLSEHFLEGMISSARHYPHQKEKIQCIGMNQLKSFISNVIGS